MTLHVETFAGGPIDTNAYLVFDDDSKQILIIDAPMDVDKPLEDHVSELGGEVVLVVLTHAHWDHIGTTNQLHNRFSAPVAAHPLTEDRLAHPGNAVMDLPITIESVSPDRWLHEGDLVLLGAHEVCCGRNLPMLEARQSASISDRSKPWNLRIRTSARCANA